MSFSVEIANSNKLEEHRHHVEIYIDKKNLTSLITRLEMLLKSEIGDDLHLMSDSWGLGDLSEITHTDSNVLTHHLQFILSESRKK